MDQIARGTPGFSGADLYNLGRQANMRPAYSTLCVNSLCNSFLSLIVNQASLRSSVQGLKSVSMAALEYAKDKIMMGSERQSAVLSEETIRMTAFHEAGHALVAHLTAGGDLILCCDVLIYLLTAGLLLSSSYNSIHRMCSNSVGADPIHKATVMPRGRALGMVMQLPDGDQTSMSRKQMIARLDVCMGGRVAEEVCLLPAR